MIKGSDYCEDMLGFGRIVAELIFGYFLSRNFDDTIQSTEEDKWNKFINEDNKQFTSKCAIDLIDMILKSDHALILTANEAMQHPYFGMLFF